MRTLTALLIAAVAAVLTACSSGNNAAPAQHFQKHPTCAQWSRWPEWARVQSAGNMADAMGAYDRSAGFHARFARELLAACQGEQESHQRAAMVAAGLATLDRADFS